MTDADVGAVAFGVLGATSWVATDAVLPALVASRKVRLVHLASRDAGAAAELSGRFGALRSSGNYDAVLTDPEVDAVYLPLPNSLHREWTERAASAGKHVLCEKPLATSAAEATAMAGACERAGVVLMEAYMTPFHPRSMALADLVASGLLGEPRFARADFTFPLLDPANHRWRPEMGGGALLDVGVYCLTPLVEVGGGSPEVAGGWVQHTPSGVDATFTGWLAFPGGFTAAFACSFDAPEHQWLEIVGREARVTVDLPFAGGATGTRPTVHHRDGRIEPVAGPDGDPYLGMVDHFAAAVRAEVPLRRPPGDSIALLALIDRLRGSAGEAAG